MSDQIRQRSWMQRILPSSLLGRLSVVMVAGVMLTQFVGNAFWAAQMRKESQIEVTESSQHLAQSAASTIRFFMSPPPNFRSLIIQQFREMGGTRFYVNLNSAPITIKDIPEQALTALAKEKFSAALKKVLPNISKTQLNFTWPDDLVLSEDGAGIGDVPDRWVQHILVTKPNPAPILVLQVEMEPGHWLYLATLMPNPYFLDSNDPLSGDRVVLQALSLAAVLLLSILVVSWITRPLAALSEAASAFGNGESAPELPETGSREFVNTARAFSAMRERIARYIEDRERLFVSISHDLRTPIMRLKLRAELLDDDDIRSEFHDDLDELDMMVKGALQCVKDSDIYENPTEIRLDPLIGRMVRGVGLAGHQISFQESGLSVSAKPLALKRAIGNLLNNAIHYGKQVEISAIETEESIEIQIRDHGPGVPEEALDRLFDPYVRLDHGRQQNQTGLGLGLSIARDIVQAHGGKLLLSNAMGGGLLARIQLPKHG
ncbi:sensor histidine kinase [Undibacterium sp. Dicai25W]|uniref:sensor histidine kinase n=1 Tax=Undibacterium sp. Dicai25W TaxID=3413034 RepID=UPI003BF438BE